MNKTQAYNEEKGKMTVENIETITTDNGGVEMNGIEMVRVVAHPDDECMGAEELWYKLIQYGLCNSEVYQNEIIPQVDKVLELHPLATMDEIARVFIDDVVEEVDDIPYIVVQELVVEDYCGTDRGFQDCSYVLGYRIADNCGAKI